MTAIRRLPLEIHQLLPSFAPRDAIGYHTLQMQSLIRSLGIRSEIFADEIKGELEGAAMPFATFARKRYRPNRYLVYQASTGSPIVGHLMNRREPVVINYHNITPKEILGRWDQGVGVVIGAGLKELSVLKGKIIGAISVSEYNRWSLEQEGITENSFVAAPFIPLQSSSGTHESDEIDHAMGSKWLFVGRITPNKAQHDIVKAFAAYVRVFEPTATLTLVGAVSSTPYADALKRLIAKLELENNVTMTGPVDSSALERHYLGSTVFVCLSDHEGFGFPIIEALGHNLPVVAYWSSAVPETLGSAGIILTSKDPIHVAAAVRRIESDSRLREQMSREARKTLARYSPENAKRENLKALATLIPEMAGHK